MEIPLEWPDRDRLLVEAPARSEVRGKTDFVERGDGSHSGSYENCPTCRPVPGTIRYGTGSTRSAENLYDPSGFLNPRVVQTYCEYMERHRVQKDGKTRDSDNWQRGMPSSRAYRSLLRHAFDVWLMSRGYKPKSADCANITDALCGVIFNAMLLLKNWGERNHHEEKGLVPTPEMRQGER
ncbi:MAG TPA: hypothetical protein VJZ25_03095 [Gemmatimonadaceae bacterium]|nr:hypothetical protein [Gemmatimonadaceae bacterium]